MKWRPIIFSSPMVRAILEGRKTQTRRVITPQPEHAQYHVHRGKVVYEADHRMWCWGNCVVDNLSDFGSGYADNKELATHRPYGVSDDQLWVREAWAIQEPCPSGGGDNDEMLGLPVSARTPELLHYWRKRVLYRADHLKDVQPRDLTRGSADKRWRSPIFMPRWASRIALAVTDVRVQRLQDISHRDAVAEGCDYDVIPLERYRQFWRSLHGPDSWETNPWVWAITFERVT